MQKIIINSIEEMRKFGNFLGSTLKGGEVISLNGDLGAGKTHLTKFIGEGMGITDYITSPTFSILNVYNGEIDLYHFDTYRLNDVDDFDSLGFDDYIYSDEVSIIEWSELIEEYLPKNRLEIFIEKGVGDSERILNISTPSNMKNQLMEAIENEYFRD